MFLLKYIIVTLVAFTEDVDIVPQTMISISLV